MKTKLLTVLLAVVLLVGIGFAADDNQSQQLSSALKQANCQSTFLTDELNTIHNLTGGTVDFSQELTTLDYDMGKLQGFVDNNNLTGYQDFMKQLNFDFRSSRLAIENSRKTLDNASRATLRTADAQYRSTYNGCSFDAVKMHAQARIDMFNAELQKYQDMATTLAAKGVDTKIMNSTLDDARTMIITPLQDAIAAAENESALRDALKSYCLYNGCPDGINFHLAAKIEIDRLNIITANLESHAKLQTAKDKLSQVDNEVVNARASLNTIGTTKYMDDNEKLVFNNIKIAYQSLKDIRSGKK